MTYLLVALLSIVPMVVSTQSDGQAVSQSDKSGNAKTDAQRQKKMPPSAVPKSAKSKSDKPTFQYNQNYSGDASKPSARPDVAKPVHDWVDFLNAISTSVVGAFTIVLAIVGIFQFFATRTAERAWIVPVLPDPPSKNLGQDAVIRWHVENRGRTPAWVTSLGSAAKIIKAGDELPKEPSYTMAGPFTKVGTVLPPEGKASRGVTIPAANMDAVEKGDQYLLYIFGIVEYRDIFGSKHETRYCCRFKPGPSADPAPRDFYVDGPAAYNTAT
jgi:hypothetical protein